MRYDPVLSHGQISKNKDVFPDEKRYQRDQNDRFGEFENRCNRCGACCGAGDDPCRNLVKESDGKYFCDDYLRRLGPQKTVSGMTFTCVDIRAHLAAGTLRPGCGYR